MKPETLSIEYRQVGELIPYARNSRTHSDAQIAQVAASIREFGWTNPVLVDGKSGIIAGHGRVLAAQQLGLTVIPVIELLHLTEPQRRAYVIADNKLAEQAGWDDEMLSLELADLKDMDFDIELTGFSDDELTDLLGLDGGTEGYTGSDAVPEVQSAPVTQTGDVWQLGRHRVMCGDSTQTADVEKLLHGCVADMVFTDPPYGVDYDGGHAVKGKRRQKLANDSTPDIYSLVMPLIYSLSKDDAAVYLWFSDSKSAAVTAAVTAAVVAAGYEIRNTLIWNKNVAQFGAIGAQYKSKHEPCLYCFKKGKSPFWAGPTNEVSVWDISRCAKNEHHPTQKPVELAERAFKNSSKAGDLVLDLFGGSGSTLIACEKTNRDARLMELDPNYCDVIVRRWQDFTQQQATLESTGQTFGQVEALQHD